MSASVPIIRNDGEGERLWFYGGGVHVWKASGKETDGALLLFEDLLSQGKATPLHVHPNEDELLYVLEGEILVHIDGTDQRVGPRGVAVAPRGVPHAFLVTSETARVLCLETPASAEGFYRDASVPATEEIEADGPIDIGRLQESAQRNGGIEILGPPPFESREADVNDAQARAGS
jgi:mannose-6-phosphate isomerase-like protein (cupin superfamily)